MPENALLIEDTPSLSMVYETVLKRAGYTVSTAFSAAEGHHAFNASNDRVILLDMMLPDGNGIDLLHHFTREREDAKIIVITANGSINLAVEAMRGGAFDFLVKPFDDRRLLAAVESAFAALSAPEESAIVLPDGRTEFAGFVGSSGAMQEIYRMVRNIGRSTATVFITGESGTGKEVCAQAIHDSSNRAKGPFVPLNCGAIPSDLLESEVFGHLKGSFTGAIADKQGAAAVADGGTLFLDEICEMDLNLQTKLLRFLQTSMIQPVGATTQRKVDVRIVCATNRDPAAEVQAGRFREDLYYRLHVVPIHLPALRERDNDVNEIANKMLLRYAEEEGRRFRALAPDVESIFLNQPWPGNVRQLLNVLRNVVVLHDGEVVAREMLPADFLSDMNLHAPLEAEPKTNGVEHPPVIPFPPTTQPVHVNGTHTEPVATEGDQIRDFVGMRLADMERAFIEATIEHCKGSIPRAARLLDVSPSTLYRKREGWTSLQD